MKKILINKDPWQTRIAITKNGLLENIYFSAHAEKTLERSFFKGIVATILPGIQTVFVDIGQEKAGFLHISEIDRELAIKRFSGAIIDDLEGHKEQQVSLKKALDVAKIFKVGEPVLVQVSK